MSAALRRRLLEASLCSDITAGRLSSASTTSALTPAARVVSIAALIGTIAFSCCFFALLHWCLSSPRGLGISGWQVAGWSTGVSIGVTAAIFTYYSLKLKRAKNTATTKKKEE
jgi:hypothetical protein